MLADNQGTLPAEKWLDNRLCLAQPQNHKNDRLQKLRPSNCQTSFMRSYASIVLLVTFAIAISYIAIVGGMVTPFLLVRLYGIRPTDDVRDFMPAPTQLAVDYSVWISAVVILTTAIFIFLADRHPARRFQFTMLGISFQGILLWLTLFGFFFEGFLGPMCLHRGPEFDFNAFAGCGFGVFPITFVGLVAAFILALFRCETTPHNSVALPT
ncbi:MAG TPA: hypothetical protein VGO57_10560 [Verrucomicrobiae bacterium]